MTDKPALAIHGGSPAVRTPLPPMFPGGMRIGAEEEAAVLQVLRSKRLFRYYGPDPGPSHVEAFERAFADHFGARHALAVTSGTAALGIGPGDEVIVPTYTWIATAYAVIGVGAVPVIAEVDASLTLDPADAERNITPHTRAIIAVHMRGAACDMGALRALADRHEIALLEDTAQACGASYGGQRLGTFGDAGAFSLQFNKIITSGEGGVLLTNDDRLHERALLYHDVGSGQRSGLPDAELFPGVNFRMSELHGAVALAQLGKLDGVLADLRERKRAIKRGIAETVTEKGFAFRSLTDEAGDAAIALVFFARSAPQAREIADALKAEGVQASTLYTPEKTDYHVYAHWTPILQRRGASAHGNPWERHGRDVTYDPTMCPRTLDLLGRAVHLNISPDLTEEQTVDMVAATTKVLDVLT